MTELNRSLTRDHVVVVTWAPLSGGVVDGADRDGAPARRRLPVDHHVVPVLRTRHTQLQKIRRAQNMQTALDSRLAKGLTRSSHYRRR